MFSLLDFCYSTLMICSLSLFKELQSCANVVVVGEETTTTKNADEFVTEDTHGYSQFYGFCNKSFIEKRPYSTATTCANHCDKNPKCNGFQIHKNLCLLLPGRCFPKDLLKTDQPRASLYYLKEMMCKNREFCPKNCLTPKGYGCTCVDDYCYPYPTNKKLELPGYHHYQRDCFNLAYKRTGFISLSDCGEKCNRDRNCSSFTVALRYCALHRTICNPQAHSGITHDNITGFDYYVKDFYHNFKCQTHEDCTANRSSHCSLLEKPRNHSRESNTASDCYCSNRQCFTSEFAPGPIVGIFTARLKNKDPVRSDSPRAECVDKHICCSTLFPSPNSCSDADFGMCPKSCGQCKSTTSCQDILPECSDNKSNCEDGDFGAFMKSQCQKTCETCGKNAKDLGINCKACTDDLPNCEDLANEGKCDSVADKCRKSCGCF